MRYRDAPFALSINEKMSIRVADARSVRITYESGDKDGPPSPQIYLTVDSATEREVVFFCSGTFAEAWIDVFFPERREAREREERRLLDEQAQAMWREQAKRANDQIYQLATSLGLRPQNLQATDEKP